MNTRITYSEAHTVNTGNYSSIKFECEYSIECPATAEEEEATYKKARDAVKTHIASEIAVATKHVLPPQIPQVTHNTASKPVSLAPQVKEVAPPREDTSVDFISALKEAVIKHGKPIVMAAIMANGFKHSAEVTPNKYQDVLNYIQEQNV